MTTRSPLRRTLGVALSTFSLLAASAGASVAAPQWAPASSATITPGVQTITAGAQCTANFVFTDAANPDIVYLGQAAHCSGTGAATETNGCEAPSLPLGTKVDIGGSQDGTLVYNSWITMQAFGEDNADACNYNDFALIRVAAADVASVNPSIPFFGGPIALNTAGTNVGDAVYSYGNSGLRLGLTPLSPKVGVSLGTQGNGWSHPVYTVSPGVPGDSGSAFLDADGYALGVTSTLALAPLAGSNNISDVASALAYMESHGGPQVDLALGTEAFSALVPSAPSAPTTSTVLSRLF